MSQKKKHKKIIVRKVKDEEYNVRNESTGEEERNWGESPA